MYFMASIQERQHLETNYNDVIQNIPNGTSNNNNVDRINRNLQLINIWIGKIKTAAFTARDEASRRTLDVEPNCRPHFDEINRKIGELIDNINNGPEILEDVERPVGLIPLAGGRARQTGGYLYPTSSSRKSKKSSRNRKKRKNKKSRR